MAKVITAAPTTAARAERSVLMWTLATAHVLQLPPIPGQVIGKL